MTVTARIALVGDYNPSVTAHQAIPKALKIAADEVGCSLEHVWMGTESIHDAPLQLRDFSGVWCVPASPYKNTEGALAAIQWARENNISFFGSCGGYQHAVLEYARNALGFDEAENAEIEPNASMPLIAPLSCALVEESADILFTPHSRIAAIHGTTRVTEAYHCSYGLNVQYVSIFDKSGLEITGYDEAGDPRTFELKNHPFFFGTAYQPERSALRDERHPLISAFVRVCSTARDKSG